MFTPYIEEIVYDIINKMIRERKLHFTDSDIEEIVNKYGELYGDEYIKYILHRGGFNKVVEKINKTLNQYGMTLYKFEVDGIWQYCVESSKIPVEIQGILCSYASDYIGNKIAADIIMMYEAEDSEYGDSLAWTLYKLAVLFGIKPDKREIIRPDIENVDKIINYVYGDTIITLTFAFNIWENKTFIDYRMVVSTK